MRVSKFFWLVLMALFMASGPSYAQEVSKEAERHMFRGHAAMEEAQDEAGFRDAVKEFRQATRSAPDWPAAWYNLGVAQEKIGDLLGAMESFKKYLELSPNASDRSEVKALIYKLEYLNDKATKEAQRKRDVAQREREAIANAAKNLSGDWEDDWNGKFSINVDGKQITLKPYSIYNGKRTGTVPRVRLVGTLNGHKISGIAYTDEKKNYDNAKVFERTFSGEFSADWSTLSITYSGVYSAKSKKRKSTLWKEYSQTFTKLKKVR